MSTTQLFQIPDLNATETLGLQLGRLLFPGAVVALVGQLGAGKTHLARAIAMGLEIANPNLVTSPTFVLIQEYPARLPIYHFDAYRLRNCQEFEDLGSDEYLYGDGVCLIEWADRIEETLPRDHLRIEIQITERDQRQFRIEASGVRHEELLAHLIETSAGEFVQQFPPR